MNRFLSRLIVDAIKHCRRQDWRIQLSEDAHNSNDMLWLVNKELKHQSSKRDDICLFTPTCPCGYCALERHEHNQLADMILAHGLGVRWTDAGKYGD